MIVFKNYAEDQEGRIVPDIFCFFLNFAHEFWIKIFLMLYSINWPNLIVWLPLLFGMSANMSIVI